MTTTTVEQPSRRSLRSRNLAIPIVAALVALVAHLIGNPHYGFFRDELYYIICGRHPALGYVDQPPVIPLLAAFSQVFGHSLVALRAIAALCAAASVYVTCLLVREFDGGPFAEILAAIAVFFAPLLMTFGTIVAPDDIGLWAWPLILLFVVRIVKGDDPRLWLAAGAVAGFAANAKYSLLFFVVALLVGLAVAQQRRVFASPWFAGGIALAVAMLAPNFAWQAIHHFPMLELLRNGQLGKNVILSPGEFMASQLIVGPLPALVAIAGFVWMLLRAPWRWLAYTLITFFLLMIAFHAKDYYTVDVYTFIFAAGAVAIESIARPRNPVARRVVQTVIAVAVAVLTLPFVPLTMPVISEPQYVAYSRFLQRVGIAPIPTEHHKPAVLGQEYADMHGWPQLAELVTRVYRSLPSGERRRAAIAASNYGEASAIAFFGPRDLPPVLSGHNQYYLWGTHGVSGDVVIDVNGDCGASMQLFRDSRLAATFTDPYVLPYEDDLPIMVCTGIKRPLSSIWPSVKNYN